MWEPGFKFQFILSLLLLFIYMENLRPIQASNSNLNSNEVPDWDWMQTGKLGNVVGGQWLRRLVCPGGSFVTGYQMKYGQGILTGEVTGLRLVCSQLDQNYKLQTTQFLNANGASMSDQDSPRVSANRQAVGFSMSRWTDSKNLVSFGGRRLKFYGEDESTKYRFKFPWNANSTLSVDLVCPEDWAVCGMQARGKQVEDAEGGSVLTQLRFKCCYYCIPQERRVILDDYTNPGSTDYTRTIRRTVGTQFDSRNSVGGSRTNSKDWTEEAQQSNSKTIGISTSENVASTNSSNEGQSETNGRTTGGELTISESIQKGRNSQVTEGRTTSESDSRSVGKNTAQINSNHRSQTKGTSSSTTKEQSLEVGASVGFSAFGASASLSVNSRNSKSHTNGKHQETTVGQSSQTEIRSTEEIVNTFQIGTNQEVSTASSETDTKNTAQVSTTGETIGNTLSQERIRQASIQRAKERSIQEGAQAMFTQRRAGQTTSAFNWDQMHTSMWREEREDTQTFTCEAMHRCKIEQVYGTCGTLQIRAPKIEKKSEILNYGLPGGSPQPAKIKNNPNEIRWDIKIPGETWVVVKGFSHWEPSGRWENVQTCPPETIVTGHSFRNVRRVGLTGVMLICSGQYGPDEGAKEHKHVNILRISSGDGAGKKGNGSRGHWGFNKRGTRSTFAEGYSFARREMNGRRSVGNREIIYHKIPLMTITPSFAVNSSRVVTKCPRDHAICGLTAMMDKSGIGILTAFGFKCCHHCIPEEKWVTVHRFNNQSPLEERKEIRATIGLSRTQTNVDSNSTDVGTTTDTAGINRQGLHAGFSARFGKSKWTGFDWSHTDTSIWNEETTVVETYTCAAFSSCTYRKLVGQCGSVRVPVDQFDKVSVPLEGHGPDPNLVPDPARTFHPETTTTSGSPGYSAQEVGADQKLYNLEGELTPVQLFKNNETWIEAQNIQIPPSDQDEYTNWGTSESCPLGSFVTGYKFKKLGGEDENTKELLTGLELECSRWDAQGNFQPVKMIPGGPSSSSNRRGQSASSSGADRDLIKTGQPAVGFHLFLYEWFGDDEQLVGQDTTGHSLIFDRWATPKRPSFLNSVYRTEVFSEKVVCPTDYVICGVWTRKTGETGVLTDIRFRCCYHCEPSEMEQDLDYQENPNDQNEKHTIEHVSVGAKVEVGNPIVEGGSPNSFTLTKGFSDHLYIKEMFSNRLPHTPGSKEPGQPKVNWSRQPKSTWTKEAEIKKDYTCKAQRTCKFVQIVGVCGKLQIPTSVTSTQYAPI